MDGMDDEFPRLPSFRPLFYSSPSFANLFLPAQNVCRNKDYHIIITANIGVKGVARQPREKRRNSGNYGDGKHVNT